MRKAVTIIAVVVFFLIVLALLVVKLLPTHSHPAQPDKQAQNPFVNATAQSAQIQTDSPSNTVRTCYAWYVQASGYGANALTAQDRVEAAKCFTPDFISKWNSTIDSTGGDPVLLAQFVGKTWNIISVSPVSQSIDSSDQLVTLGTGSEQAKIVAHVVKDRTTGAWQIASVSSH